MKKVGYALIVILTSALSAGFVWWQGRGEQGIVSPTSQLKQGEESKDLPLTKYSFPNLKNRGGKASQITIEKSYSIGTDPELPESYLFFYTSEGRKISGLFNIPQQQEATSSAETEATESVEVEATESAEPTAELTGPLVVSAVEPQYPVIIMIRGYVDQEIYETGVGTKRAGEYFAKNGFITLAPDFLGYGESDNPPDNVWEERFLRSVAVMDLIASIPSLPEADPDKIGIWGHSNGGMIALSVLELIGADYPTVLWAPVSQSFPYDILYYTYEFEDKGKALRQSLAGFEENYDVNLYSFDNYLDWIKAPIQLHQGKEDEYIPLNWSNSLVGKLDDLEIDVTYYTYPNTDHNMNGSWERAVERDLKFFQQRFLN